MSYAIEDRLIPDFNYWPGRAGHAIEAVCVHSGEGTLAAIEAWFRNRASQVSSQYGVGKDGRILRFVAEEDTAWCNGPLMRPDRSNPLIDRWVREGINPNRCTVSIETEHVAGEAYTDAQVTALGWLYGDIARRRGFPPDRDHGIGHYQLDSINKARCPGPEFPWDRVLALAAARAATDPNAALQTEYAAVIKRGDFGLVGLRQVRAGLVGDADMAKVHAIAPDLPAGCQMLVCEKAVLWCGPDGGKVQSFHRMQYEALLAAHLVVEYR